MHIYCRNVEKAKNASQAIRAIGPIIFVIMVQSQKKLLKNARVKMKYHQIIAHDVKNLLPILKEAVLSKKLILVNVWEYLKVSS